MAETTQAPTEALVKQEGAKIAEVLEVAEGAIVKTDAEYVAGVGWTRLYRHGLDMGQCIGEFHFVDEFVRLPGTAKTADHVVGGLVERGDGGFARLAGVEMRDKARFGRLEEFAE